MNKYGFCEHVRGPLPLPNTILAVEFGLVESEFTRLLASARKLINLSVSMCARDRASIFAQLCCFVVVAFSNIGYVSIPTQYQKVSPTLKPLVMASSRSRRQSF